MNITPMKNYRIFHLICVVLFLSIGIYSTTFYKPETSTLFSQISPELFKVPVMLSLFFIIRKKYIFSAFWKDILLILAVETVLYIPDFLVHTEIDFIIPTIFALSTGALISLITISFYEKTLHHPTSTF